MPLLWGTLLVLAGLFLLVCATLRSEFALYKLLVARSRMLWSENAYRFHQIAGAIVIVVGVLVALGYI